MTETTRTRAMTSTSNPKTAALRLAEALGFHMHSSGNRWIVSTPGMGHVPEAEGGILAWSSPCTAEGALGLMVDVAAQEKGAGLSFVEIWDACMYVPRPVRSAKNGKWEGRFDVEDTWQGTNVQRMLKEAHAAGRKALVEVTRDE